MKKVVLGICGGIAAYKMATLARLFVKEGASVHVVMTEAGIKFITPLTFETLTGNPVYSKMFDRHNKTAIPHIDLAQKTDLFVLAPATANTIAKLAYGLADNLLSTLYLAATCPTVVVPAMNVHMLEHQVVQKNIALLKERGCHVLEPGTGELACGEKGRGRLPEPEEIFDYCEAVLTQKDFSAVKAVVTAGPTREPLDPVRFLSNPATGLMGYKLAAALQKRGAEVVLITGPTHLKPPYGVKTVPVNTADEMYNAVFKYYDRADLVIKTAAVSDYRPKKQEAQKVKKDQGALHLPLALNRDILLELGRKKNNQVLVGFAAETENVVAGAREKLEKKNLDLIVANDLSDPKAGFAVKTNRVTLINRAGQAEELPLLAKEKLAGLILDRVLGLLKGPR